MVNSGGNDILTEREVEFSTALRGYDRREVDAYIRRLRARAGHLASELEEKEQRLSEVGGDASVPLQVVGSGNIGARVERIIAQAEHEAKEIRDQAEQDAAEIRKAYENQADEARRQRDELARRADSEAREMIRRAEEEVARLRTARQTVLEQLLEIGEIVDGACVHAARTPELHAPRTVLALGPAAAEDTTDIEDTQDTEDAADTVDTETAEHTESVESDESDKDAPDEEPPAAKVPEQAESPDTPKVAEPRKPAEPGKINPAILAAKARRQAKQDQAAAVASD
ncbi:DivIVA domain-containing protein [Amycolatopsis endophytica]|uniref:DivIVA domain-containing protein n=1 Tax=Amycolatopsis endophytica TaxID=860233 RepID=A0A853BF23_9PSEU|nr:DivIVA domain-containing protein [Amycolatopsis endophytica]NYI93272.1 DivIVA domain-containing protein [Amycolatopsis endophytica]